MKGIEITAINILDKEIKIKGVWDELEPKNEFQRQPVTKYLRLILVVV